MGFACWLASNLNTSLLPIGNPLKSQSFTALSIGTMKTIILLSDAKSGPPCHLAEAIESLGCKCKLASSPDLSAFDAGDLLIIDRCSFIVPSRVWQSFELSVNCHPSMLPLHRGAHPLLWAPLFQDPVGVTIHTVSKSVDMGLHLYQSELPYSDLNTFRQLHLASRELIAISIYRLVGDYLSKRLTFAKVSYDSHEYHHRNAFSNSLLDMLPMRWDTSIGEAREMLSQHIFEYRNCIGQSSQ